MNLWIDNKSGAPIYEQIYQQIKAQIIGGELKEDTPLPSIRNLAKDLHISVITTKRAYDELEKDGFLYTVVGKGSFVARKSPQLIREELLQKTEEKLREALQLAAACRITKDELWEMLCLLEKENET